MARKPKKRSPEALKSYQQHCLDDYMEQFNTNARNFAVMMFGPGGDYDPSKGPGVTCVGMSDTLRALLVLHLKIAVYREAIIVADGGMRP